MPALRAVIFDLDDILYPERAYVLSGFHAVAAWAEEQLKIPRRLGFAELRQLFEDGVRGNTSHHVEIDTLARLQEMLVSIGEYA
jgi:putative hydrolase of the HAD superfamily